MSKKKDTIGPSDVDAKEDCPICKEMFQEGEKAKRLPCNHRFHGDCLGKKACVFPFLCISSFFFLDPWLSMRNTCPICRRELPAKKASENPNNNTTSPNPNANSNSNASSNMHLSDDDVPSVESEGSDESEEKHGKESYNNMFL